MIDYLCWLCKGGRLALVGLGFGWSGPWIVLIPVD